MGVWTGPRRIHLPNTVFVCNVIYIFGYQLYSIYWILIIYSDTYSTLPLGLVRHIFTRLIFYSASRFSKAHLQDYYSTFSTIQCSLSHLRIIRVNPSHYYTSTTEGSILTSLRSKSAIVSFFQTLIK